MVNINIHHIDRETIKKIEQMFNAIIHMEKMTMAKLSDFMSKYQVWSEEILGKFKSIKEDMQDLKSKIEQLQNTQGELSEEDQAILEDIAAKNKAMLDEASSVDDMHPPKPPEEPMDEPIKEPIDEVMPPDEPSEPVDPENPEEPKV